MDNIEEVLDRINMNYKGIHHMIRKLDTLQTYEEKTVLISIIGAINSGCITGEYSNGNLENELKKIGEKIDFKHRKNRDLSKILIVMTKAYEIGGHSVLVNNLINMDLSHEFSLILTDQSDQQCPKYIKDKVFESGGKVYFLNKKNILNKAEQLLNISDGFGYIIMFTHMYDVVPIIAYSNLNFNIPVLFYHHADFRFSFGYSIADKALFLCDFDRERAIKNHSLSPDKCCTFKIWGSGVTDTNDINELSPDLKKSIKKEFCLEEESKIIISMGHSYRYEDIVGCSFLGFAKELIDKADENVCFIVIGPSDASENWRKLYHETNGRIRAMGYLPIEKATKLIGAADLYIVSFPVESAGENIAYNMNVPILHYSLIHRYDDYFGNRNVSNIDELIKRSLNIVNYHSETAKDQGKLNFISKNKSVKDWYSILDSINEHKCSDIVSLRSLEEYEKIYGQLLYKDKRFFALEILKDILSKKEYEEVFLIVEETDKQFGFNIMKEFYESKTKNYDRYKELYDYCIMIRKFRANGYSFSEFFSNNGYETVAVYGGHEVGKLLVDELKKDSINVKYGIDKNSNNIKDIDIKIYHPSSKMPSVDVIINATRFDNKIIKEGIKEMPAEAIISLYSLVKSSYN